MEIIIGHCVTIAKGYALFNGCEYSIDAYYLYVESLGVLVSESGMVRLTVGDKHVFNQSEGNRNVGRHGMWPIKTPTITLTDEQIRLIEEMDMVRATIANGYRNMGPHLTGRENLNLESQIKYHENLAVERATKLKKALEPIFTILKTGMGKAHP